MKQLAQSVPFVQSPLPPSWSPPCLLVCNEGVWVHWDYPVAGRAHHRHDGAYLPFGLVFWREETVMTAAEMQSVVFSDFHCMMTCCGLSLYPALSAGQREKGESGLVHCLLKADFLAGCLPFSLSAWEGLLGPFQACICSHLCGQGFCGRLACICP